MWPVPLLWLCKWSLRLPKSDSEAHVDMRPSLVLFASGARREMYVWIGSVWPQKVAGVGNGQVNGRHDKCGQGPGRVCKVGILEKLQVL